MAVTIRDVAKAAGVSVATVSRSLHGMNIISAKTREHVAQVARELGYELPIRIHPDSRDRRIAVVLPFIGRWYFARIMEGIERVTREHGYEAVVLRPVDSTGEPMALADHLESFGIKGAIMISQLPSDNDLDILMKRKIPAVMIDMADKRFTSVTIDDVQVGRIATKHLIDLGHKKIAILTGDPNDPKNFSTPNDRRAGYHQALTAAKLPIDSKMEIHGDFTARGASAAVMRFLTQEEVPTAIFAASDEMAFGAMGAAKRLGLKVPEDISIVGVDDHDISETVGLTTVAQPIDTMAEMAAWQLIGRMNPESHQPIENYAMPVSLVVRQSTSAPGESAEETHAFT
jgi:LacI family repressor for deo operon, udp, cdd, tsx, nupC, and nupG